MSLVLAPVDADALRDGHVAHELLVETVDRALDLLLARLAVCVEELGLAGFEDVLRNLVGVGVTLVLVLGEHRGAELVAGAAP